MLKRFVSLMKLNKSLCMCVCALAKRERERELLCLYITLLFIFQYQFISEILRWRAVSTSDHVIFTSLNAKRTVATSLSCSQLHKKAERIGNLLLDRGRVNTGEDRKSVV